MEVIIAPAIRTESGKIYISRYSHANILRMYPLQFKYAEQGFITSRCRFVDREEGLKIAKEGNGLIKDNSTELFSEDLFLEEQINRRGNVYE